MVLALALAGCPAVGTGADTRTSANPAPTPTPPPGNQQDPQQKDPTFAIKAFGPVSATLVGGVDVEHGPVRVDLRYHVNWGVDELGTLGTLLPVDTATDSTPFGYYRHIDGGRYERMGSSQDATHAYYSVNTFDYRDRFGYTLGEATPLAVRDTGSPMQIEFAPPAPGATFKAWAPEGTDLVFLNQTDPEGTLWSFTPSYAASVDSRRGATMSVTVAVKELDGTPMTGLAAANFKLSIPSRIQATETASGIYRIVAEMSNLYGLYARPQFLTLSVTHAGVTHTHQEAL